MNGGFWERRDDERSALCDVSDVGDGRSSMGRPGGRLPGKGESQHIWPRNKYILAERKI